MTTRATSGSDEGYTSSHYSPLKSKVKSEDERLRERFLVRQAKEFKQKYYIEKVIINSANGIIYQGHRKSDGLKICAKQVSKQRVVNWENYEGQRIPREFHLHLIASPIVGVVQAIEFFERKTSFVLIMEKPEDFIDVYEFTQLYGSLKENPARVIFDQVVKICIRLQNFGIFHRDIKDENILLNVNTLEAKLIDFGCAIEASTDDTFLSFSGTPEFAAPEVRQKRGYQADSSTSWTLGVLLYVLLFGDTPFPGVSEAEVGLREKYDESILSPEAKDLMNKLLDPEPLTRMALQQIHSSSWMQQA